MAEPRDINKLIKILIKNRDIFGLNLLKIESLNYLFKKIPFSRISLKYSPGGVAFKISPRAYYGMDFDDLVGLAYKLKSLMNCRNVNQLINNFSNPSQILDTFFEVEASYFLLTRNAVRRIEFYPVIRINNRQKRPDLLVELNDGEIIYGECKNIHRESHKSCKLFNKLSDIIFQNLSDIKIPTEMRIDIHQDKLRLSNIRKDLEELRKLLKKKVADKEICNGLIGDLQYSISLKSIAPVFSPFSFTKMICTIGDTPAEIGWPSAQIRISAFDQNASKSIKRTIEQAYSQLPREFPGVIFLKVLNPESAILASHKKLTCQKFDHIWAVGIFYGEWTFRCSPTNLEKVKKLVT